jgi:hypothetical protein
MSLLCNKLVPRRCRGRLLVNVRAHYSPNTAAETPFDQGGSSRGNQSIARVAGRLNRRSFKALNRALM